MVRVLFVCLGNICRSPMAEAVFQHKVREAGLAGEIESDSAGTGHWHVGNPPHAGTRQMLAKNAIPYEHRARLLTSADLNDFDYILTMDDSNLRDVRELEQGRAIVRPFLDYAPQAGVREVPDPFYTGGFEDVYALVDTAAAGLLAAVRETHKMEAPKSV